MRAVALLGLHAKEDHVRRFEMPGVNLFSGNELDPTDMPDAALVFGGDGTIHRHLGGLALKQIPTLMVPVGSANDFAQSIGVDSMDKALAAWRRFCSSGDNVRSIDLGTIEPLESSAPGLKPISLESSRDAGLKPGSSTGFEKTPGPEFEPGPVSAFESWRIPDAKPGAIDDGLGEPNPWQGETLESLHFVPDGPRRDQPRMGRRIMQSQLHRRTEAESQIARTTFFCCLAGTGLDAAVNRLTLQQPRWLRGNGGYVLGLLQVLGRFHPPHITVSVESEGSWQTRVEEAGFLIAVGNGPQYGNGMRLTHEARMDDGLFDVCFVKMLSKLRLLWLFRAVYHGGHIAMKEVEYFRASRLRIASDPITEIFADGEYICRTPVELGVRRDGLRVIVA